MSSFINSYKINLKRFYLWLLIPIILGLCIRLIGIRHGEPDMIYHPDVAKQVRVALATYNGNLNLRKLYHDDFCLTLYPYGDSVIAGKLLRLYKNITGSTFDFASSHLWNWDLGMRYQGIFIFLVSLAFFLIVIKKKWGNWASLYSGLLLSLEPFHSQFNHYAMNDAPLIGIMLLVSGFSILTLNEKKFLLYPFLCGLSIGIGFGIKYQAIIGFVFPGIIWLFLVRSRSFYESLFSALMIIIGSLIGVYLTCPLLWTDRLYFFSTFPVFMKWQANIMNENFPLLLKIKTNLYAMYYFFSLKGHWLLLAGALGAFFYSLHEKIWEITIIILSSLLFSALLFFAILLSRDIVRPNDLIPVFTFLIPAWGAWFVFKQNSKSFYVILTGKCLGLLLIPIFFWSSLQDSIALSRVDTRITAKQWCDKNLPADTTVALEKYTLSINRKDITEKKCKYLPDIVTKNGENKFEGFQYLIMNSLACKRFFNPWSPYSHNKTARETYQWIENNCKKTAFFSDREMWYAQPEITVYKLPENVE